MVPSLKQYSPGIFLVSVAVILSDSIVASFIVCAVVSFRLPDNFTGPTWIWYSREYFDPFQKIFDAQVFSTGSFTDHLDGFFLSGIDLSDPNRNTTI